LIHRSATGEIDVNRRPFVVQKAVVERLIGDVAADVNVETPLRFELSPWKLVADLVRIPEKAAALCPELENRIDAHVIVLWRINRR
jgi:hypothetical protein